MRFREQCDRTTSNYGMELDGRLRRVPTFTRCRSLVALGGPDLAVVKCSEEVAVPSSTCSLHVRMLLGKSLLDSLLVRLYCR